MRRIAVLDDDPTGSQTVHGVPIVLALDELELAAPTTFFLTNSRSLPEREAAALTGRLARALIAQDAELVSRSDSTLRGHVAAEVEAIEAARRDVKGRGYDAVLLAPAFFEAGRFTRDDVHWAGDVPVGETEFAQDPTFGYRASNLREFVAEKCPGADVSSLSLEDIRAGRTAERLAGASGWVVVNAEGYDDLDAVVRGIRETRRDFLYRTGPSFVRALAGIEPIDPLTDLGRRDGHGLVVVGSHVGLTTRQIEATSGLRKIELDVTALDPETTGRSVADALRDADVLLYTSRELVRGDDPLATARRVSAAVSDVVRRALDSRPAWIIAKGGITSHDVAVHGLGIRRATVLGQLLPGMISVFEPLEADPRALGVPYVVFAGNVGDEHTLAEIVRRLRA